MVSNPLMPKSHVETTSTGTSAITRRSLLVLWLPAVALLLLGLGIRLYDLTDPPLDFHPTRQLRGALIARGMYYQMLPNADPEIRRTAIQYANSVGQYEPSILEKIVAETYLLIGGENLWVARIYTSLFWIIAGAALFALARRMTSLGPALISLGYFLFLPFAVQASRSFQPDPGMVMWIVLSAYTIYRWSEKRSWKWAILTGLLAGMAVLVKVVAGYIVACMAVAVVLYTDGIKRFWRDPQVWAMAVLMATIPGIYYLGLHHGRAGDYFQNWTLSLLHLLIEPSFYVRWFSFVQDLVGLGPILIGLAGVLIAMPRCRALLIGLWAGYFIYGLSLPYQMYTHSYYHEQLIPIIALSLAPAAQPLLERIFQQTTLWKTLAAGLAILAIAYPLWVARSTMASEDNRKEPAYWQQIASYLPTDGKIIGLTQDYGYRLMYYGWRKVDLWPSRGDRSLSALRGRSKEFEDYFAKHTQDKSYFLVTAMGQLNDQPDLKELLSTQYPVTAQGDGYIIYDLAHPSAPATFDPQPERMAFRMTKSLPEPLHDKSSNMIWIARGD